MPYVVEGYQDDTDTEEQGGKQKGFVVEGYKEPEKRSSFKGGGLKKAKSMANAFGHGLQDFSESLGLEKAFLNDEEIAAMEARDNAPEGPPEYFPHEDEPEERFLRRLGRNAPLAPISPISAIASTAAGSVAEEAGVGEGGQAAAEFIGGLGKPIVQIGKAASKIGPKAKQFLPSGIEKPRAMGSKLSKYAQIGEKTQENAIKKIDAKAAQLTEEAVHKHLPISQKMKQGFDFEKQFQDRFRNVEQSARAANVKVDLAPVKALNAKYVQRYEGIPNPHVEATQIQKEIKAFNAKPPDSVAKALKTYRSNSSKITKLEETAQTSGRQKEYVDYLKAQNRAITESYDISLPDKSAWLNEFKSSNKDFSQYKRSQQALKQLEEVIQARATPAGIEKLVYNSAAQKKLARAMGQQGADEVIQIAKDMKGAVDSLKGISKSTLTKFDAAFPSTYLIPIVGKIVGATTTLNSAQKIARNALGFWLSRPETRRAYGDAIKALKNQDLDAYKRAAAVLTKGIIAPYEEERD